MSTYLIGLFEFISLPYPIRAARVIEREIRPGLPYHSIWITGFRHEPKTFTLVTDVADLATGDYMFRSFRASIGTQLPITWNGTMWPNMYDIIDVHEGEESAVQKIIMGVGGTAGTSGALIYSTWTVAETNVAAVMPGDIPDPDDGGGVGVIGGLPITVP
jgi:hypothetical protein